jgi:hypothetical protein
MPRVDLALKIQEWVHPTSLSRAGRLLRCVVPGHEAKQYEVVLVRRIGVLEVTCSELPTHKPCKGNGHSICYHSMAAVIAALRLQGFSCEWHENPQDNVTEGAKVIEVRSGACDKAVYVSVKEESR